MKRFATFLLLLCVTLGLAAQQPAGATSAPMATMDMASMSKADMTAMPDCMAAMSKDVDHKPCKCGLGGCIAMMSSGAAMMLPNEPEAPISIAAGERLDHLSGVQRLRGRATVPEPEPPSVLI
ncbi:MAG: hypothetical protein V4459_04095 [Pseudomonadota bacterium]